MPSDELQEEVFLTCRTLFAGPNAQLRRPKKVREVLQQHRHKILPLVNKHGLDNIADGARHLLEKGVFESNLRAKIQFPELFQLTPARGAQRTASENEAARSEAEALAEAEPIQGEEIEDREPLNEILTNVGEDNPKTAPNPLTGSSPTLFPAYLPYKTQHHILTITQTMLEEACFGFGKKWLPQVLSNEKWDCPEAVELTKWTKTLAKHRNAIPLSAVNASQGELSNAVLFSTDRLRHAAVHRLPTSAGGIQTMILSAVELATMLNDTVRAAKMEQIHCELASIVKDMEVNKEFLESRLDDELKAVAEQRAELDRREQRAVATMLNDDKDYQMYVSSLLDKAVTGLATTVEEVPCAEPLRNTIGSAAIHDIPCNGKELADGFGVGDDDEEGALQSKVVVDVEHAGPSNSAEFCS